MVRNSNFRRSGVGSERRSVREWPIEMSGCTLSTRAFCSQLSSASSSQGVVMTSQPTAMRA